MSHRRATDFKTRQVLQSILPRHLQDVSIPDPKKDYLRIIMVTIVINYKHHSCVSSTIRLSPEHKIFFYFSRIYSDKLVINYKKSELLITSKTYQDVTS